MWAHEEKQHQGSICRCFLFFFLCKQYRGCLSTILVWPAFAQGSICQLVEPKAEGSGCLP